MRLWAQEAAVRLAQEEAQPGTCCEPRTPARTSLGRDPGVQVLSLNFLKIELKGLLPVQQLSSEFFPFQLKVTLLLSLHRLPLPEEIKLAWNQQTPLHTDSILLLSNHT